MKLHPIPPGYWCVPSALICLTGADGESVVQPAFNRHGQQRGLHDLVVSASTTTAGYGVLRELGYNVRRFKREVKGQLRTWAIRSAERWPGRALLVTVRNHALVVQDGRVYDTFTPHGGPGTTHPYARSRVLSVALVERS